MPPRPDEHWWFRSLMAPPLAAVNLDRRCEQLRGLELLACDLIHVNKLRGQLLSTGQLLVVTEGVTRAATRRRAVAHALCNSYLHDICYEHVCRGRMPEMKQAEADSSGGSVLIWADMLARSSSVDDLDVMLKI